MNLDLAKVKAKINSKLSIRADLLAGLSVAGLLLPEAVAYSSIAGMPAQAGIIASFIGLFCYALIGHSRFAAVSATSSSAAILAVGVTALADQENISRPLVAATLVLLTGVCFLLAGFAKLGGLSQLVARPVLRGYAFGLAIVIALKQFPILCGMPAIHGDFVLGLLWKTAQTINQVNFFSIVAGCIALLLLLLCERLQRLPGSLLVIVIGIMFSGFLVEHGVALTGSIHISFNYVMPYWPKSHQWLSSIQLALALLLILYAESYSSIRSLALKHGDQVATNRDLMALGVANVVSGFFQGMPVGAGFSATSANEAAGAQSRLSGLIAAIAILFMVVFLLSWIERIPAPILAAIVIHAVSKSWHLEVFQTYFKWQRDRIISLAAAFAVLSFGISPGLLVAIALSIAMLLHQMTTPKISMLGKIPESHDFVDILHHPQAQEIDQLLILRPEVPLFFANAETILSAARDLVNKKQSQYIILSLELSPDLDGTALEVLNDFSIWLQKKGKVLLLARLKDNVQELLLRAKFPTFPAAELDFWSVEDAVCAARQKLGFHS